MSRSFRLSPSLLVALCLAAAPVAAFAQVTVSAECKPLLDATRKVITTPHHSYFSQGQPGQTPATTTGEEVLVGGVSYVLIGGKWTRSPMTQQELLDQEQENIKNAKVFSCRHEGDQSLGGVAVAVYSLHQESDLGKADGRLWVAKSSGLVVQMQEDIDSGAGTPMHMSIRYEYTNVRAPAVQ